ncbi:putative nucleotidyltransferase, Ribonuclease H [Helianthus annuus]|nr:putative nucleotidyltransferase, Ribonuclease H [Helianthus annuus]
MQWVPKTCAKMMRPKNELAPVTTAWPFQQWGIDMVGPFPEAPGAVKFIIVAVDYFTKWVEAKALASTMSNVVKRFIWKQIICRFGLPLRIITDNGTNFAADDLERWFKELHIEHTFSSVAHPQWNGQVEAVNKSIVDGIKARLGEKRRGWVDELPSILWAHRTMPKTSNGETPFSLVYGSEAVIPAEIGLPSPRMLSMNLIDNEEERRIDLDLLEERREMATINEAKYKTKLEKYYNSKVRVYTFNPGDYVLRDNEASNAEKPGKLAPKWEGPYIIEAGTQQGSLQTAHHRRQGGSTNLERSAAEKMLYVKQLCNRNGRIANTFTVIQKVFSYFYFMQISCHNCIYYFGRTRKHQWLDHRKRCRPPRLVTTKRTARSETQPKPTKRQNKTSCPHKHESIDSKVNKHCNAPKAEHSRANTIICNSITS